MGLSTRSVGRGSMVLNIFPPSCSLDISFTRNHFVEMFYNKGLIDKDYCKSTSLKTEKKPRLFQIFQHTPAIYFMKWWQIGSVRLGIRYFFLYRLKIWKKENVKHIHFAGASILVTAKRFLKCLSMLVWFFLINQNANQNILTSIKNDTYFLD